MGFLARLTGKPDAVSVEDPNLALVRELMEDSRQQRKEMMQLVGKMVEQQTQSALVQQQMMQQYVAQGQNTTTTLDSRLFAKDEKLEDDLWVTLGESPFQKLGLG